MDTIRTQLPSVSRIQYLVLGEQHGVKQNADLLSQVVDHYAREGTNMLVAFEWPLASDKERILHEYAACERPREDGDVERIFDELSRHETGVFSDGHRDLFERIREYNRKAVGDAPIKVAVLFPNVSDWNERDRRMAEYLRERGVDKDIVIAMVGVYHARRSPFRLEGDTEDREPMASHLSAESSYTVKLEYTGGQFYNFGVHDLPQKPENDAHFYDAVIPMGEAVPITR